MMSRGYVYLLLLDHAGQVGELMEYLEGKGGESDVAMSVKDCAVLAPMASLELCTNHTMGLWAPIS
jgi:hypothetical protein